MHWTKCVSKSIVLSAIVLFSGAGALFAGGQTKPANAATQPATAATSEQDWWKTAVVYEIYPRSFQDSNGDGIGDLNGITQRLDYLKTLGVDALWLAPIYPSPQADYGYDIADYKNIEPAYGTLADFDRLIAEANKRHIRILMDMVMNHTSDEHKWFLESRSSRTSPYRDWYVWHDGKGQTATDKGTPPNNWVSAFGGSAWEWDEKTRQYYYHKFYTKQPDVNWDNPKIHEAFKDVMAFWLKRGVAGFRFDAITTLYEDPQLRDEDVVKDKDGKPMMGPDGKPRLDDARTNNLPGVHPVMQEMRAWTDKFNSTTFPGTRVMIGETYLPNAVELAKQYGTPEKPEFHLPMDTQVTTINKMDVAAFRTKLTEAETELNGNTPLLLFDNHDNPRMDLRYGDGVHDTDIQRVLSTVLFASRGAAQMYYGDEIGMKTTPPTRKEDVKDPVGQLFWPMYKGRDGERTPMQWDATANAGFTTATATPWLPVPPNAATINAKAEQSDPASLFAWYQKLIELKKSNPALAKGDNTMLDTANTKVLSWVRQTAGAPAVVVSVNFTAEPQKVSLSVMGSGGKVKTLLKTPGAVDPVWLGQFELGPFGVFVGEVQ
jgi:alpha-glucosidase